MLRVWIVEAIPSAFLVRIGFPSLTILLLYLAILRSGAQSVIVNRNTWCSNGKDKYKEVQ